MGCKVHRAWRQGTLTKAMRRFGPSHATALRGPHDGRLQITKYVEREIINHRCLVHPHIVQFREVGFGGGYERFLGLGAVRSPAAAMLLERRRLLLPTALERRSSSHLHIYAL